eukprot:TRINITY_DN15506_c0_g1_i2.p1 TRINITY_DN15506_c0_g1~~TRINITY_DN15506_c0_g1_i2.p1  ORF type:complete len:149 (+),score=24.57 TRINITY_DN15506_c0_g1_i2:60-449(+)
MCIRDRNENPENPFVGKVKGSVFGSIANGFLVHLNSGEIDIDYTLICNYNINPIQAILFLHEKWPIVKHFNKEEPILGSTPIHKLTYKDEAVLKELNLKSFTIDISVNGLISVNTVSYTHLTLPTIYSV